MEKTAIITLDSNDLKLTFIDAEKNGLYNVTNQIVENIKLGEDIALNGIIKQAKLVDALNSIKMFRKVCDNKGVTKVSAVATSIFKNARNYRSFFEEVYNNTAINFNVLSVEDEIKDVYYGVINYVDIQKGIILNINSYSTNIVYYNRRNILWSYTLDFGKVNLADKFLEVALPNEKWDLMKKFVLEQINQVQLPVEDELQFIGSGLPFVSFGKLAKKVAHYPLNLDNNYIATSETAEAVFNLVKTLELDKTKKLKGISEERADVLLSGLAIISALFEHFNIPQVTVTLGNFEQGALYSLNVNDINDRPVSDMLGYSLETITKFYNEGSNCSQVYNLAMILFRQLKVLHKLPRQYLKSLRIASSMYDCGKRVNYDNNSKYGFDVIINSRINGVSQKDILLAAFACLCQNLDNFNLNTWVQYKDILSEDDLDAVRKLGTIITLASYLDCSQNNNVTDICCDILGDSIIIKTVVNSDASFDIKQAMKLASNFKKVFKRSLQII